MRRLVSVILKDNANCAVIAHNHPGGPSVPSKGDIAATRHISQTLRAIGVDLLDHIIVGSDDICSMRESDYMTIFE
jgi:DNA repair protein RadC